MSKTKINLKLIIALLGVAFVMCLVPLGVQALATDEATDATATDNETQNANPEISFVVQSGYEANIVVDGGGASVSVPSGSKVYSNETEDGIGRLYLQGNDGDKLLATCYPSYMYVFKG